MKPEAMNFGRNLWEFRSHLFCLRALSGRKRSDLSEAGRVHRKSHKASEADRESKEINIKVKKYK